MLEPSLSIHSDFRITVDDPVPLAALKRALVIKLRHHGDVLLTSPVFQVLKNHAPELEIDALVYADTAPMLTLHPAISQVHTIDRKWKRLGMAARARAEWALLNVLRTRGYDLIVHLTDHPRGAWMAWLTRARWAVGPKPGGAPQWWKRSFTHLYSLPRKPGRHTVERNLDALRRIGIQPGLEERRLVLVAGREAEHRVDQMLADEGLEAGRFVHLHPGSRWLFKCWPAESNAELIDRLHEAAWPVVVTAAPESRETRYVNAILARTRAPVVSLAGQLTLKELAALTARACLFIGVDSAPMHIAAAMGTRVVALFGPSAEHDWGPWLTPFQVVASDAHPCRPCGLDGCGGGKVSECLTTLPLERVLRSVDAMLSGA